MENQLEKIRSDFKREIAEIRSDLETKIIVAELRAEIVEIRNLITERPKVFILFFKILFKILFEIINLKLFLVRCY